MCIGFELTCVDAYAIYDLTSILFSIFLLQSYLFAVTSVEEMAK